MAEREKAPDVGAATVSREPRTSVVAGWRPELIRSAERQCAYGSYTLAADLCESMFSDDRVSKCLGRLYSATTLPLAFKLPGYDDEQSKEDPVCKALDADWWKMLPESTLSMVVKWLSLFGACLAHVDGWRKDIETGRVIPVLTVWHSRNLRSDPERGWQALVATDTTPFGEWTDITPGDGNWVLFENGAGYRSPLHSPLFGVARWFLLGKLYAPIDWASQSERHGQGREYIENTLTGSQDSDTGAPIGPQQRKDGARELSAMGRNAVAWLPRGWTAKLVTDGAKTFETFAKQTDYANMAVDIALIGTNLTTEVSGGSFSAAQVHQSVDAEKMRGLLERLSTTIREQLLVWWHRYNFGRGLVPYPKWDTTPPADKESEGKARQADATALKIYREAGAQLNQKAWFEGRVELLESASDEFPEQPKPVAPKPPQETQKAPPKPAKKASAEGGPLAVATETAFERGRDYIDRLETECCAVAAKRLATTVASVVAAIDGADSYEDAMERVKAAYQGAATPSRLVKATEAALILAELAGAETVEQEFETEE